MQARADDKSDYFKAIELDHAHTVRALLQAGFDANTRDPDGQVGLFLAFKFSSGDVADALLEHRHTQIDLANEHGETALMMACLRGDFERAKRLVAAGARIERPPGQWTPLHYAASGPSTELAAWLLARGAAIDALSPNGTTPLMMAARYGAVDTAELLRSRGASRSLRNQRGLDAEAFARGAGRDELAGRLRPD